MRARADSLFSIRAARIGRINGAFKKDLKMANKKYPFTPQGMKQAFRTYIESLTDEELCQFAAYGGYFGFSRNSEPRVINTGDIRFIVHFNNKRIADEALVPGCIIVGEPQNIENEDLDEKINENIPLERRFSEIFKVKARKSLMNYLFEDGFSWETGQPWLLH